MKKANSKRVLIAGVLGAFVGSGAVVYKNYNKYKNRKSKNEFNLLKLEENDFLTASLKQVDIIDAEVEKLKTLLPIMAENIKNDLAINNPKKYAKTIEEYKNTQKVDCLDIIVPLVVDNMRLDRLSNDLESLKKDYAYLNDKILKAYVTGNVSVFENEGLLFDSIESEISALGKELSTKLMTKDEITE